VSSSVARAKRLPGVSPSAQTLGSRLQRLGARQRCNGGSRRQMPSTRLPRRHGGSSQQRACRSSLAVKALAALAQSQGASRAATSSLGLALATSPASALQPSPATGAHGLCPQFQVVGQLLKRGRVCKQRQVQRRWRSPPQRSFSGRCSSHRLLGSSPGSHQRLLPNPSLVGTATGKALGPRGRRSYHRPRGPSAFPASAPQLKR